MKISTFLIICSSVLLTTTNVSDKILGEIKTHISGFFSKNRAVLAMMWKNILQQGRPHDKMAHAHCILDN